MAKVGRARVAIEIIAQKSEDSQRQNANRSAMQLKTGWQSCVGMVTCGAIGRQTTNTVQ